VTSGEIDAQVIADGKTAIVRVTADGHANTVNAPVNIPGKVVRVDPNAPMRIVRAAHKHLNEVDYLALSGVTGSAEWAAFFTDGTHYVATPSGRKVHRIG
jgi:hypothetical protein